MGRFIHDKYTLKALELVRQGRSLFITGKAGTGKTTLLKEIVKECRARGKKIVVSAPTGIAARNADGQTLHSLFGLKAITFIPGKTRKWFIRMDDKSVNVIKNLQTLIIDEVSMVRCDLMDMVDLTLQYYKKNKKPFGGIQVILFGDLFQLPPVVTDEDKDLLYSHYEKDNPYFFSSDVIRKYPIPILELNNVHRQKDKNFVEILNHIREGNYLKSDIDKINKRLKIGYEPSQGWPGIYLRTINKNVYGYNYNKLMEMPGKSEIFLADKDKKFPKSLLPADYKLELKVGAKVMILRNDNDGHKFVNGTQGKITSIHNGDIRVKTDEGHLITVKRSTWKLYKYEWDKKTKSIVPIVYATFTQYPLKLAWAVTIHKSQGMTFNNVTIDAHKSFAAGQVYVALSRCRSLKGITLTSRISERDIMVDPKVVDYMKTVERIKPDEDWKSSEKIEQPKFFLCDEGKTITGVASEVYGIIVIPEGIEKIADDAFKENTKITGVVCPNSLREIGEHAFLGCENLEDIKFNEGLTSIGLEAFLSTNLESVNLPSTLNFLDWTPFECKINVHPQNEYFYSDQNGILYNADETALILFPRKKHEEIIEVSKTVTCIESYAFEETTANGVVIPKGIQELQSNLFSGCPNLKTITLESTTPSKIKIDKDAFKGFEVENCVLLVPFEALSKYKRDKRFKDFKYITAIEGSHCLLYDKKGKMVIGCDNEECKDIDIPEGVTSINDNAFKDNELIENVTFSYSLSTIGCCAFSGCANITDIRLTEGLTSIDWDAFRGTGLSHVYIPSSVEYIGPSAFKCEMEVDPDNTNYCTDNGILYSFDKEELVIFPANKGLAEFEVPDFVEKISCFAFEDTELKSVTLPGSIKTLGQSIFGGDSKITKLTINIANPNVLDVDEKVFEGFDKSFCKLIVPNGCSANYFSDEHFKGFRSIAEMQEGNSSVAITKSSCVTGQYLKTLSEYSITESKTFCQFEGKDFCYVVMTSKGFFLSILNGGYYFLSDNISDNMSGNIWVQNKRGRLSSYDVSYTTDGVTPMAFGHFTESYSKKTLTYKDLKTGDCFTLNLRTGKRK